uniref:Uncharacterized protein n=1 Tax=Rhizophora mucronata TaxID=61149 RepID=A0A2P2NRG4_RHIMU
MWRILKLIRTRKVMQPLLLLVKFRLFSQAGIVAYSTKPPFLV